MLCDLFAQRLARNEQSATRPRALRYPTTPHPMPQLSERQYVRVMRRASPASEAACVLTGIGLASILASAGCGVAIAGGLHTMPHNMLANLNLFGATLAFCGTCLIIIGAICFAIHKQAKQRGRNH